MSTIPASQLVSVTPSVLGAGGSALDVIGLILTNGTRVPIGTVQSFSSAAAVASYFGSGSAEDIVAGGGSGMGSGYFGGFDGSNKKPGSILFAQYNESAVGAFLRGGDVSNLTLTELQAITGTLIVTIDGVVFTAGSLSMSAATSFSSGADIIETDLNAGKAAGASFTGVVAATTLTASSVTGTIRVGHKLAGSGVTADTIITEQLTGTAGSDGTYRVSISQTVGSESMTSQAADCVVTYDSVSGAYNIASGITGAISSIGFATGTTSADLMLTSATGAVISQGAAAAAVETFMDGIVALTTNWVTFMTTFDPDDPGENTVKLEFADWVNTQNNRYCYVCWDTDASPTTQNPATGSLGYLLDQNDDSGTCLIYEASNLNLAAFICGAAASIDFTQTNGRITFAYKSQSGLMASVTDETVATNLGGSPQGSTRGNGYNFYGAYAAASDEFTFFQRGFVSGAYLWLDSYINQIWLNNSFQSALLNLLANAYSVPYTAAGRAMMESALADPIAAGLNFGAYGPGVLSASQIAQVNQDAGSNIANTLQTQGWYLQILPGDASTRANRTTPPAKFWYIDSGSVQANNIASVAIQ